MEFLFSLKFWGVTLGFAFGLAALLERVFERLLSISHVQRVVRSNIREIRRPFGNWNELTKSLFLLLFGPKHISIRCFFACAIWSLVLFFVVMLGWYLAEPENVVKTIEHPDGVFLLLVLALIVNIPTDYLSLLQTRLFVEKASEWLRKRERLRMQCFKGFVFMIADLVATAVILTFTCLIALFMMWAATTVFSLIGFPLGADVGGQFRPVPSLSEIYQRAVFNGWRTGINFAPLHADASPPITGTLMVLPTFIPFVFVAVSVIAFFLREVFVKIESRARVLLRKPVNSSDSGRVFLLAVTVVTIFLVVGVSIVVNVFR